MDGVIKITIKENDDVVVEGSSVSIADTIKAVHALMQVIQGLRKYEKKEDEE